MFLYIELTFQMLHSGIHRFQLLRGGAGQLLDVLQRLICLEFFQCLADFFLRLRRFGEDQEYFHRCPPFQSVLRFNLCPFSSGYVDRLKRVLRHIWEIIQLPLFLLPEAVETADFLRG